ncbi:MAG: hypothetical protein ACOH5I_01640 [Oligoflexus sp.]
MQYDADQSQAWIKTIEFALPKLLEKASQINGRALILGASVLQIYQEQKWITRARATGDLDLSIGLVSASQEYNDLRQSLLNIGYKASDSERYFRLYSPNKVAIGVSYLDLLAHPEGDVPEDETRSIMGVGDGWGFGEILFALEQAYEISRNVYIPNPLGFLALKRASYIDDPRRVRDLVDIVELVFELTNKALHYELRTTWKKMSLANPMEASRMKSMISGIANEEVEWDFSRAEQELQMRGYDFDTLEIDAPRVFDDFLGELD